MSLYSNERLTDSTMSKYTGTTCVGYGTGASHERIILGAGGEIGYDGFKDPHPNEEGNIIADRVFISERTNEIKGINFFKNGKFCCSYKGANYVDIKKQNSRDYLEKQQEKNKSEINLAEKEFDDAYEKGDMNVAKEYLKKIDSLRPKARENDIQNECQNTFSELRNRV